ATEGQFEIALFIWDVCYNDPMDVFESFKYKTNKINFTNWESSAFIRLLDQANTETDKQKKEILYIELEKTMTKEMPLIPLYYPSEEYVKQEYLQNVILASNFGDIDFKYAYIDKNKL
ncbi:MAG: hypothetical protein K940chlam8_01089, partial [Chlamydiae bacterium]|nr:hypothetical protein [Chlamydiota bacterium]